MASDAKPWVWMLEGRHRRVYPPSPWSTQLLVDPEIQVRFPIPILITCIYKVGLYFKLFYSSKAL